MILAVAVWIYALIDLAQTPEDEVPQGLPKAMWLILIIFVPVIGAIAWLVVKWVANSGRATRPSRGPSGGIGGIGSGSLPYRRPKRKGPMAPDDDPEFLANLDWQARKAHYERQKREKQAREAAEKAAAAGAGAGAGGGADGAGADGGAGTDGVAGGGAGAGANGRADGRADGAAGSGPDGAPGAGPEGAAGSGPEGVPGAGPEETAEGIADGHDDWDDPDRRDGGLAGV